MDIKETSIPYGYEACLPCNCPRRDNRLRAWVWSHRDSNQRQYVVLNPDLTTLDAHCPFYCDDQPQRYALGFTNFQQRMYPGQYQQFMSTCIDRFGRNPYFMRRRGDTPIPHSEQAFIRRVLKQVDAPPRPRFRRLRGTNQLEWLLSRGLPASVLRPNYSSTSGRLPQYKAEITPVLHLSNQPRTDD